MRSKLRTKFQINERGEMMKNWKKVVRVVLPIILSLLLIPFFGIVSHAEGGNNSEALEESSLESGINYKVGDIIELEGADFI